MKIDNVVYRHGLFGLTPAMEAPEDLTATTNDALKRSGTRNRQNPNFEPPTTSDETKQEDGGNIGGGDDSLSADIDSITPENASGGEGGNDAAPSGDTGGDAGGGGDDLGFDDDMAGEGGDDAGGGDDFGGGGDDFGGDSGGMGDESTPEETPEEVVRIRKLQEVMNQFYTVLTNTCDSLASTVIPSASDEVQRVMASTTMHLNEAKAMLLDILTTKFTPGNYAYKLRKYLALRHLYSTSLEIIEMHSSIVESQRNSSAG